MSKAKAAAAGKENAGAGKMSKGKEKKMARKAAMEKAQGKLNTIKAAYALGDPLAQLAAFKTFERNGASFALEHATGAGLGEAAKAQVLAMLEANMAPVYGEDWEEGVKGKVQEMCDEDARYILCFPKDDAAPAGGEREVQGFVHYRFVIEEEVEVLYVYELQIGEGARRKGLGKFMMAVCELWARKCGMKGVMLTVQRVNSAAMAFYKGLKFDLDEISPAKVDPLAPPEDYSYEILSKIWDNEAKTILTAQADLARKAWNEEYDALESVDGNSRFRV